ncbi:MAG: host attachment protein [Pseudomonadota bacterium]|nr:host attachment protein [Pseudomonadota bacterium]
MAMHWVIVGDAAGAKVYESDALLEELKLVDDISFSHGHVQRDDGEGHSNESLPGAGHSAEQAEHDPHKVKEERFARAVAEAVNVAAGSHRFERLIVVAPPRFLGDVRAALSHSTAKRLVASIHHDWTRLSRQDLSAQLRKNIPDTAGLP